MGRVSRDARLLFVLLWTICDDEGKTRGASRMLASLLFPYDDDAKDGIIRWLNELENEGCIIQYKASGHSYIKVCNWADHQKIDRPSTSKIADPSNPRECSRASDEPSSLDQRTEGPKDQDQGIGSSELSFDNFEPPDPVEVESEETPKGKTDHSEPCEDDALLFFPTSGKKPSWFLTQQLVNELSEAFPAVDVMGECRKALAWVRANPKKKKTHAGMAKFLTGWMGRVQDRGGSTRGPPAPGASRLEGFEERMQQRMAARESGVSDGT
jgi:hypothetical protein